MPDSILSGYLDATKENANGNYGVFPTLIDELPDAKPYIDAFEKKFGKKPERSFTVSTYLFTNILLQSLKDVGSADDMKKVAAQIKSKQWPSPWGPLQWDE